MPDNIARINGVDQMAYVGEKPWHSKGTYLGDKHVDSATIAAAAGLDYDVTLQPVWTINPTETITPMIEVPRKKAVVRADTGAVLGMVGPNWEPVQNRDSFRFADALIGKGLFWETAGALGQGERMWALARFPGDIDIAGDAMKRYIMFANGHDGSLAFTAQQTLIRVVCDNTLQMAIEDAGEVGVYQNTGDRRAATSKVYRMIHKRGINAELSPEDAAEIVGLTEVYFAAMKEVGDALAGQKMSAKALDQFIEDLFPLPMLPAPKPTLQLPAGTPAPDLTISTRLTNIRSSVKALCLNGKGNDRAGIAGSKWAALNGVVEYADFVRGNEDTRPNSILFGGGKQLKQRAFDLLVTA